MKRDNINYFAVGVFVIAMGVVLLVILYKITGRTGPVDMYHVYYDNVSGIKYGTAVFYEGYQVGQVESITPRPTEQGLEYRVDFSVERGWRIPEDSVAKVVASGLLAAVSIDIEEGQSEQLLEPGERITGQGQVNVFSAVNDMAKQFGTLSDEGIKPLLSNLNERISELSTEYTDLSRSTIRPFVDSLHSHVDDPELWRDTKSLIAQLDRAAAGMEALVGEENQQEVRAILANTAELSRGLAETRSKVNALLEKVDGLVADNREGVRNAVADTELAARDLRGSLEEVSDHIDAVMYHLEGTSRHMNEFARSVRENPGLLIRGAPQEEK